jgi:hypothetical protein
MVGALTGTGVIHLLAQWSVKQTGNNITILTMVVLWFSAIVSAFLNNIPFVTAMVPFIKEIGAMTGVSLVPLMVGPGSGRSAGRERHHHRSICKYNRSRDSQKKRLPDNIPGLYENRFSFDGFFYCSVFLSICL